MMRIIISFFIFAFIVAANPGGMVLSPAAAQSQNVQKALESAKETLDNLISAKDEKGPAELALRVETLKKAVTLSIAEAKDARTKLVSLEDLPEAENAWKERVADTVKSASEYFETQYAWLEKNESSLSLAEIKDKAKEFKAWRETNYLPALVAVRDYFLINQEDKTIETAEKRAQKIEEDMQRLEAAKVKKIESARKLLTEASAFIKRGKEANIEARELFFAQYVAEIISTSSSATSSLISTSSPVTEKEPEVSASASSSDPGESATSTEPVVQPIPPSIRDLVKDSLSNIKEAYKVFIEMSNLVRKLLR